MLWDGGWPNLQSQTLEAANEQQKSTFLQIEP